VRGEGWNDFSESVKLFANWVSRSTTGFLPPLETLAIAGSVRLPHEAGRLHFATQLAIRQIDQREVVQLRLTARGRPTSGSDIDVLRWMDLGREWVVRAFADITSPKAHELWKRTR
jgi:hypothetical protein